MRSQRQVSFAAGMCVYEGSIGKEAPRAMVIICSGFEGCGSLGCQDFPGKCFFLHLHHAGGIFLLVGMWEGKMGCSHLP